MLFVKGDKDRREGWLDHADEDSGRATGFHASVETGERVRQATRVAFVSDAP